MSADLPSPRSILVINVSRIGDTLLVTPALRALARAWPTAAITVLGHRKRVDILRHLPFLAHVGAIDKRSARIRGWLPGQRWDLALVYGHDKALVDYALRVASRVVAYRQDDPALDVRLFRCVPTPPFQHEHSALLPQTLTRALGRPMIALYHCYSPSRLLGPLQHPCFWAVDLPREPADCTPQAPMAEISVDMVWARVLQALPLRAPAPVQRETAA
jgi:hypothetical protein